MSLVFSGWVRESYSEAASVLLGAWIPLTRVYLNAELAAYDVGEEEMYMSLRGSPPEEQNF